VWFGGLAGLVMLLRAGERDEPAVATTVGRFSAVAAIAVLAVAASGGVMSWVEVRTPGALTSTTYGWTLLVKLGIVALVVGLAAYNRRRLVPAVRAGSLEASRRLRRTVAAEAALIAVALIVTGFLVNLAPARVEAGVTGPYSAVVQLGTRAYSVTVDPNRAGVNEIHVQGFGPGTGFGEWTGEEEFVLRFSQPGRDIAGVERRGTVAGPHHWVHVGPELAFGGRWTIELRLQLDAFTRETAQLSVDVGG
jgi:copper transport protein